MGKSIDLCNLINYLQFIFYSLVLIFEKHFCVGDELPFQIKLYDNKNFKGGSRSVNVTRCQNLFNVAFNDKASSLLVANCAILFEDPCCQGKSKRVYASVDDLESIGFDNKLSSISPCAAYQTPAPHQIHETWSGHGQIMTKVAEGHDIVIYYNDDLQRTALQSHSSYLRKAWAHVKKTYGEFGPEDSRLYAFFHAQVPPPTYNSNSVQSYFDIHGGCRNVIDFVGTESTSFSRSLNGTEDLDLVTHEIAHLVEWASKGVYGSPTYQIWGDSAWAEIFTFDVYHSLGLHEEKERWYKAMQKSKYDSPRAGTYWFRDWFFPLYTTYGGGELLNRYFEKLSQHFPRKENGWEYSRDINLGEFVHFFSGAAKKNLRAQAKRAFRWDSNAERELIEAKMNYPGVWY